MRFQFPCPDCRTTNNIHEPGCSFENYSVTDIEAGYHLILERLSLGNTSEPELFSQATIKGDVGDSTQDGIVVGTPFIREACDTLYQQRRIRDVDGSNGTVYELLTPDEYREEVSEPQIDPVKTVYEKGSVPGCHDNAVFALIAFYEMVGLSWEETRIKVLDWLDETGTWDRGGFEENTPEELVDSKKHVYDSGYGWKEKAKAAKSVIDRKID